MTTKRAVAYLRQSVGRARDERDGGSVSIAYQLDAVTKWCQSHDTALVAWHQDVDESGAKVNRAGLDAMLRDVATIQPDAVIFWDLKRLTRNLRLFLDVFDKTEQAGADMVSVTEGTRHPAFVWKLLALMAEEERDRIAVNITHGKRESTKRGRHLGYRAARLYPRRRRDPADRSGDAVHHRMALSESNGRLHPDRDLPARQRARLAHQRHRAGTRKRSERNPPPFPRTARAIPATL